MGLVPAPVVFHTKDELQSFGKKPLLIAAMQDSLNREPAWLRRDQATEFSVDVCKIWRCSNIKGVFLIFLHLILAVLQK